MPIRRATISDGVPGIRIFRPNLNSKTAVFFYGKPDQLYTHWIDNRTMPCLDSRCPWCPERVQYRAYAPAALWIARNAPGSELGASWEQSIVEFTSSPQWESMEWEGGVYWCEKGPNKFIPPYWRREAKQPVKAPPPGFNVIQALAKVWGLPWILKEVNGTPTIDILPPGEAQLKPWREQA